MKVLSTLYTIFCLAFKSSAQVRLPGLVRDSMMLQRETNISLWGRASAWEKISIKFNNEIYRTTAGADGKWAVKLSSMKAGGPYTMSNARSHILLKNILIGDV